MTVKLLLLKSGEDIITDVKEMVTGSEEDPKVIGYFLNRPCIVKMRNPTFMDSESDFVKRNAFEVSLYPWMPLSKNSVIPISTDWVITMVDPVDKLLEMYTEDVINNGKETNEDSSTDEQSDSNQSD